MNVVIVSSRFPWPPHSGDRLRATIWLRALERHGRVVLVSPPGRVPDGIEHIAARRSLALGVARAAAIVRRGLPLQSLLAAPYDWDAAIGQARASMGRLDAIVVLLARVHPWVRDSLGDARRVHDAVDALSRSMRERAAHAPPIARWLWRLEERRVARLEEEIARGYERIVVVADAESQAFGGRAAAISNGVVLRPLDAAPRPFHFGFWGRLAYFANADAAHWLLDEIWPRIRAALPDARLLIAGAAVPRALAARATRADGVTLLSPADDIPALARQVRVALLPIRYGTGESTKTLEAAEAGCGIAATPAAFRGLASLAPLASIAENADDLARAAIALLADAARCASMGAAMRAAVERDYSRETSEARLAALLE